MKAVDQASSRASSRANPSANTHANTHANTRARLRPRLALIARLVVTLAALALIFSALGTQAITSQLSGAHPGWLALAVLALGAQIVLSACRWARTCRSLALDLDTGTAIREYFLAVLGNTLLPGGILGDMGRVARLRQRAGIGTAAHGVIIERMAGQVALGLVAALGVAIWLWPSSAGRGVAVGLGLAIVLAAFGLSRLPHEGRGALAGFASALRMAWLTNGAWRAQLGLSAAILACNVAGFWAAAQAVGITLSPAATALLIPLTLASMLIPLSINGWGLREGTAAALWPLAGISAQGAVAASILFGLAAILAALPGLWPLLRPAPAADAATKTARE